MAALTGTELQKYLRIPAAWRGMDTDSPMHLIPEDRAQAIDNFVPGVYGQLPARRGFTDQGLLRQNTGTAYVNLVMSMITHVRYGGYTLTGVLGGSPLTSYPTGYVSEYQTDGNSVLYPSGKSPANGAASLVRYDEASGTATADAGGTYSSLPDTQHASYEGSMFWTAFKTPALSQLTKAGTSVTGRRLHRWAGCDPLQAAHANTATVSNGTATPPGTTVTLGTAPTGINLTGTLMRFNSENAGYAYNYEVLSHTTGATTLTLAEPYGLGEDTTHVPDKAGAAVTFSAFGFVINSPVNATTCINHLDRIFVGRPTVATRVGSIQPRKYANAIQWCEEGQPEKWPDTNIIIVGADPNEMVMGFARVGKVLIIFKKESMYVMSGDTESTFAVSRFSGEIGCVDSRSITYWNDSVIWASRRGIHMINPDMEVTDLTKHTDGPRGGISRAYQRLIQQPNNASANGTLVMVTAGIAKDYLFMLIRPDYSADTTLNSTYPDTMYVCHLPTRSWARWYPNQVNGMPLFIAQSRPSILPYARSIFAAAHAGYLGLGWCLNDVAEANNQLFQDSFRNTGGASTTDTTPLTWTTGGLQPWPGHTFNAKQLYVHHGWVYTNSSAVGWSPTEVRFMSDGGIQTTGPSFSPRRFITGSQEQMAYYIDQIIDTALPSNINTIQLHTKCWLTSTPASTPYTVDYRLYELDLVWDTGRQGYSQTKVT